MDQLYSSNMIQDGADALGAVTNIYESWSVFSLNSSGQLQGTLWLEKNGQRVVSGLGQASYQFYDKDGAAVAGLSETGLTPDGNGQYLATPITNPSVYSLTHYVIKISIFYDGQLRESYRGLVKED